MRSERDAAIVEMYKEVRNMAAVGRAFGLTRERIRAILAQQGVPTIQPVVALRPARTCKRCERPVRAPLTMYCRKHHAERQREITDKSRARARAASSAKYWADPEGARARARAKFKEVYERRSDDVTEEATA